MPNLALTVLLAVSAADFTPARFSSGGVPPVPVQSADWSQAVFELSISSDGSVARVEALSPKTPFLDSLGTALRQWKFTPAEVTDGKKAGRVESRVLVAGILRPPQLRASAPAPTSAPATSAAVPRPAQIVPPPYPPRALIDGIVVVEVSVGDTGAVGAVRVVRSSAGFDAAAIDTAKAWRFQPAVRNGRRVPAYVYLVFGFRQPVIVK